MFGYIYYCSVILPVIYFTIYMYVIKYIILNIFSTGMKRFLYDIIVIIQENVNSISVVPLLSIFLILSPCLLFSQHLINSLKQLRNMTKNLFVVNHRRQRKNLRYPVMTDVVTSNDAASSNF